MASAVAPPLASAPPGPPSVTLSFDSPAIAVSGLLAYPTPTSVTAYSSDAESSVSPPPHSALSSAVSSVPLLPVRYFPPDTLSLLCAGRSFVVCGILPPSVAVPSVPYVISRSAPSMLRVVTRPSLFLLPALLPPPLLSRGLLRLPAPYLAPPPLAPAANIACKDKDVGNWTGRSETIWSAAGGSALRGKSPNSPLAVVGDGISHPWFLHQPQQ